MPSQKTIIHIIPKLSNGGAENVLLRLVEEFSKSGTDQVVITLLGSNADFNYPRFKLFCKIIHAKENPIGVKQAMKANPKATILAWMYKSFFYSYFWKIRYKTGQRILWNVRRSSINKKSVGQRIALLFLGMLSRIQKTEIIFCAYKAKEMHKAFGFHHNNAVVIQNRLAKRGNNDQLFPIDLTSYLLYVGRYNKDKGPDRLIRIAKCLNDNGVHLKIVVAGDLWTLSKIPQNLQSKFILLGNVGGISSLYQGALALLFTSYTEGYPNVIAEAVSNGTPVIGFEAGDSRYILADYPFGHTVVSETEFLSQLKSLLHSPPSLEDRQKEAAKQQKKLDFSLTVKEYEEFIWND